MTKCREVKLRFRSMFWLVCAKNKLSMENKRLLYVSILKPMWMYCIQLWDCAADTNVKKIHKL